ncbi:hypothetical protein EDF24_3440 [Curtobacterium sp. PhB130]|uniref:hypothetical protein n=1 Tax=Curtobacterium sp. PhB130 TaxID=2485178 RepID=UPI000F4B75DE|nr:hypothetical protein [Curtobacterium sp. PhB130]ROS72180.1 hypothetical protein EDF24_3440 [Curtobacterium sp. PhB130]
MTETSSTLWQIVFLTFYNAGTICVAVWVLYLYVVILSQGSRKAVLTLSRLEQRCAGAVLREPPSHRAWQRFRSKHLSTAQGVRSAQRLVFRPASWLGLVILVDLLGIAALLAVASMTSDVPRSWDEAAFALAFFSAVPWLTAMLLERVFWHRRARSEWEVVLLGEVLATEAANELDQDYVGRRTARVLGALGRRLPRGSARQGHTAEGRVWLLKTQPSVQMRAELVTTDVTEKREWSGWVASWLDVVSESFEPRPEPVSSSAPLGPTLPSKDPDVIGLGALIAICCGFGLVGVVFAAFSSGLDSSAVWDAWDSTAGRLTTFVGLVGAVLGIVGFRRGRTAVGA